MDDDDNDNNDYGGVYMDDWGEDGEEESDDDDEHFSVEEIEDEIVETFIRTFSNGDYDAEFDDKLCLNRMVPVPAQFTQASYNKPDNWVERNQIGLGKVKCWLQECINLVTDYQSFELDLIYFGGVDNVEPIVWHEPIVYEYWDQLEAKIYGRSQQEMVTDISGIHIENVEIMNERLPLL